MKMMSSTLQQGTIRVLVLDVVSPKLYFTSERLTANVRWRNGRQQCTSASIYGSRHFSSTGQQYVRQRSIPSREDNVYEKSVQLVNGPSSTLPAPIEHVERRAFDSSLKYYFAMGKAYVGFYKTGMKNVYHNYKAAQRIRQQIGLNTWAFSTPPMPNTGIVKGAKPSKTQDATAVAQLSRADFQLLYRSAYDVRRVIPFSLMLLICGELTPFVVMALGSLVVPKTCLIPRQIDSDEIAFARRKRKLVSLRSKWGDLKTLPQSVDLKELDPRSLRDAAFGLNLASRTPPTSLLPLLAKWLYTPRLRKHLAYLAWDDRLIKKYGGVGALNTEEVKRAVLERGGVHCVVLGNEREDRIWLEKWLSGKQ